MGVACLEFRGENFRGWLKNRKFVKIVSLESFLLAMRYNKLNTERLWFMAKGGKNYLSTSLIVQVNINFVCHQ